MSDVPASAGEKPSAIRARLDKFKTVEDFIQGYSQYFFRGGLLLPTRNTRPEGTRVALSLEIDGGITVVKADGVVQQVRMGANGAPIGMVIRFTHLDPNTEPLVDRALEARKGSGRRPMVYTAEVPAIGSPRDAAAAPPPPVSGSEAIDALASALDSTFDSIFGPSPTGTAIPTITHETSPSTDHAIGDFLDDRRDETLLGVPQPFAQARPATSSEDVPVFPGFGAPAAAASDEPDSLEALFAATRASAPVSPQAVALDDSDDVATREMPRRAADAVLSEFFGEPTEQPARAATPTGSGESPRTVMGMRAIGDELVPRPTSPPTGEQADQNTVLGRIAFAKVSRAELEAKNPQRETPAPTSLEPPPPPPAPPQRASHLRELLGTITSEHGAIEGDQLDEIFPHEHNVEQQLLRRLHESQPELGAAQGERAIDALVASAPESHPLPPSPTSALPAVAHSQRSWFQRLLDWLRGLFG